MKSLLVNVVKEGNREQAALGGFSRNAGARIWGFQREKYAFISGKYFSSNVGSIFTTSSTSPYTVNCQIPPKPGTTQFFMS